MRVKNEKSIGAREKIKKSRGGDPLRYDKEREFLKVDADCRTTDLRDRFSLLSTVN